MTDHELLQISRCPLFSGEDIQNLKAYLSQCTCISNKWEQNQIILHQNSEYNDLTIITEGSARAETIDASGKTITIETLKAPEAAATAILFTERRLPVQLVAHSKSVSTITLSRKTIIDLSRKSEPVLTALLKDAGDRLGFLADKIKLLTFSTIREKLISYVAMEYRSQKSLRISIPYTQEGLAELFGVTRPALARIMGELEKESLLKSERGAIVILDLDKLKREKRS